MPNPHPRYLVVKGDTSQHITNVLLIYTFPVTNALVFFSQSVLNLSANALQDLFFFFLQGLVSRKVALQTSSLVAVIFPNTNGAA